MIQKIFYILTFALTFPLLVSAQCSNFINPGTICCDQTICAGEQPAAITESSAPTGGSGVIEYEWHQLEIGSDSMPQWGNPLATHEQTYQPDTLFETSYFLREVRRAGCMEWRTANVITINVLPTNDPACAASAVTQPNTTNTLGAVQISPNPFQEKFTVYNGAAQLVRLQVFNAVGVLMNELQMPIGEEMNVDASNWQSGTYIVRMEDGDGRKRSSLVVKM